MLIKVKTLNIESPGCKASIFLLTDLTYSMHACVKSVILVTLLSSLYFTTVFQFLYARSIKSKKTDGYL